MRTAECTLLPWQHGFLGEAAESLSDLNADIDAMQASLTKIAGVAQRARAVIPTAGSPAPAAESRTS